MKSTSLPAGASDEWLAVSCQLGDPAALDLLIDRWHAPLWRYARRVTGREDEADDVIQDAWIRILRALPGLKTPSRLGPWLFGITRRVLMDRLRAQYAAPRTADVDADSCDAAPLDEPDDLHARLDALERALTALPVIEREVLVLFYLEGLSLVDIADALAAPVGTIKSRLFRARNLLRKAMAHGNHPG